MYGTPLKQNNQVPNVQKESFFSRNITRISSIKNNVFNASMFLMIMIIIGFIVSIFYVVFTKGISGGTEAFGDWTYFFFGDRFSLPSAVAGGFMVINTLWVTLIAVLIASPISILTALFITRVAPKWLKPLMSSGVFILSAIPSVIFGAFGLNIINPWMVKINSIPGSIFAVVIVLVMMITPTITMMTVVSINNVDLKLESSSLALGATKEQTSLFITLRSAIPGIFIGILLAVGRALGEATAVSMVATQPNYGPTFGFNHPIRLLTTTMLSGWNEGELNQMIGYALAILLLMTIVLVFVGMKWAQIVTNPAHKIKKQQIRIQKRIHKQELKSDRVLERERNIEKESLTYSLYTKTIINSTLPMSSRKKNQSWIIRVITSIFSIVGALFLIGIVVYLLVGGSSSMSWTWMTSTASNGFGSFGDVSGMGVAFWNTLLMILTVGILLIPFGVIPGIYFAEYKGKGKISSILSTFVDFLAGVPSLLFGIVGFAIFVPIFRNTPVGEFSAIFTLTFIAIPTVIRSTQNAMEQISPSQRLASLGMGSTKSRTSLGVILPQAIPSITSGLIISLGRVIGESAALIILGTAGSADLAGAINYGGPTLATMIYSISKSDTPDFGMMASIGIILLGIILILIVLGNYVSAKKWRSVSFVLIAMIIVLIGFGITNLAVFVVGLVIVAMVPVVNISNELWVKYHILGDSLIPTLVNVKQIKLSAKREFEHDW